MLNCPLTTASALFPFRLPAILTPGYTTLTPASPDAQLAPHVQLLPPLLLLLLRSRLLSRTGKQYLLSVAVPPLPPLLLQRCLLGFLLVSSLARR
jgi:hypothetical protein